jgi:hypothetical protein
MGFWSGRATTIMSALPSPLRSPVALPTYSQPSGIISSEMSPVRANWLGVTAVNAVISEKIAKNFVIMFWFNVFYLVF